MKISPVVGTPTLPNTPSTGLSPEKIERLKQIASGKSADGATGLVEKEEEEVPRGIQPNRIKMNVNRSVYRDGEPPQTAIEAPPEAAQPAQPIISDTSVQTTAATEETVPLSPQLAALARQRRALQVKERELAEKAKLLEGPSRTDLEARIKSQPLSVLQELGVTYEQLTNEILANQSGINPDIQALKAEIKALKEGVDKTLSDKDAQAEQAVLSQIRQNINQLSSQGDDFELVRETRSEPDVLELIHRTYKQTGEVLDEGEALKLVEEELSKEALKLAKIKKVQAAMAPVEPIAPTPAPGPNKPQPGMRTLTNKDLTTPQMSRRQRAMAAALGTLKR